MQVHVCTWVCAYVLSSVYNACIAMYSYSYSYWTINYKLTESYRYVISYHIAFISLGLTKQQVS